MCTTPGSKEKAWDQVQMSSTNSRSRPPSYAVHSKVLAEPDIEVPRYGSLKAVAPEGRVRRFANNDLYTEALEEERERVSGRKKRTRR